MKLILLFLISFAAIGATFTPFPPTPVPAGTLNAEGDLLTHDGVNDLVLPKGTPGQVLTSTLVAGPQWIDPAVGTTLSVKGDIQVHDGTDNVSQGIGADGSFLVADSNEINGMKWSDTISGILNPVSDWETYTPTTSWDGTLSSATCKTREVGDTDEYECYIRTSGSGAPAVVFTLDLKNPIDPDKIAANGSSNFGFAWLYDNNVGANRVSGMVTANASIYTNVRIFASNDTLVNSTVPFTWATNDTIRMNFKVPVLNRTSGTDAVVQNRTTSLVEAEGNLGTEVVTSLSNIPWLNEVSDSKNLWDGYALTLDKDSCYSFDISTRVTVNHQTTMRAFIDNVSTSYVKAPSAPYIVQSYLFNRICANAGQTISFRFDSGSLTLVNSGFHRIVINEVTTNGVIAATLENINSSDLLKVRANNLSGGTDSSSYAYNYVTSVSEVEDNYNALTDTGNIVFTVPANKSGHYDIDFGAYIQYGNATEGADLECGLTITSAHTSSKAIVKDQNTSQTYISHKCSFLNLKLDEGDTVLFYTRRQTIGSVTWNLDGRLSYLTISESATHEAIVKNLYADNITECQTKRLTASIASSGIISELGFSNLTIGKNYSITTQVRCVAGDVNCRVRAQNGALLIAETGTQPTSAGTEDRFRLTFHMPQFTAIATTMSQAVSATGSFSLEALSGNNEGLGTFSTLCELPSTHVSTTKF